MSLAKRGQGWVCRFCKRQFVKKDHLNRHERIHTGEKPFPCKYCGTSYVRSDVLTRHVRTHHGDVAQLNSNDKTTNSHDSSAQDASTHSQLNVPSEAEIDDRGIEEDGDRANFQQAILYIASRGSHISESPGDGTSTNPSHRSNSAKGCTRGGQLESLSHSLVSISNEHQIDQVHNNSSSVGTVQSRGDTANTFIQDPLVISRTGNIVPPVTFRSSPPAGQHEKSMNTVITTTPLPVGQSSLGQLQESQRRLPYISGYRSSDGGDGQNIDYWPGSVSGIDDTSATSFHETADFPVFPLQTNRDAAAIRGVSGSHRTDLRDNASLLDVSEDQFPLSNSSSVGIGLASQSAQHSKLSSRSLPDEALQRRSSLSSREEIAPEHFARVEQLWPAPRQPPPRSMGAFWTEVANLKQGNAFALTPRARATKDILNQDARYVHGWNDECHTRLQKYCRITMLSQIVDDHSFQHGASASSTGSETCSSMLSTSSETSNFPESRFLEMGIGLYFRRYHAMNPIIHQATFNASATSDSLILSMCLTGLIALNDPGVRSFVHEQLPGAIERSRSELVSRSIRRSDLSQILCALAAAILLLHLSAMVPNVVPAERVHLLYIESLGLALRNSFFVVDSDYPIDTYLWNQYTDADLRWMTWCRIESVKRLIISIILIDSSQASHFDAMPILNPDSIHFVLPCTPELFDARDATRWTALIKNGARDSGPYFELTNNSLQLPPSVTDWGLQSILGSVSLRALEAHARLIPTYLSSKWVESPLSASPLRTYGRDPKASAVAPLLLKIYDTYAQTFAKTDANNLVMWNSIGLHLCTNYNLVEVAAGRFGAEQANFALNQISQSWVHTPEARRACLHAAQIFDVLSRCRALDRITVQSEAAAFESALVLGLYLYLLPESLSHKRPAGGESEGQVDQAAGAEIQDGMPDKAFELLDRVDWKAVGNAGMVPDSDLPTQSRSVCQHIPAVRFITHGGPVTFSDSLHYGGFESARSVFVEYLGLLQDIGKWNVLSFCHILRVLSVTTMEDGLHGEAPKST